MIDFSNVKSIVIPEGEVSVIARGTEVLWKLLKLPPEYQEVPYIESTGTQYLDTGIYGTSTLTVEATALATQQNSAYFVFGARSQQNGATYACLVHSSKRIGYRVGAGGFLYSSGYDATDDKHTYKIDNGVLYRDGIIVDSTCQGASTATNCPVALLTINTNNKLDAAQTFRGYLYSCKMWDKGTLVRDLIPCYRKSDGKVGMYDLVTDVFFTNAGTGEFACKKPKYKRELLYLESTGTQYIDTNYAFKEDFSWEIDFEGITLNKSIFGGRTSTARTAILYQYNVTNVTTCPIGSSNGQVTPFQLGDLSSGRHTVKMAVASNKGSVWVDKVQKYNNTAFAGTYISGTTQAIFADKFGSGNIQEYTSGKVYGLKMWQGTNLVRNFSPVLDWDDVPCMFDKVTDELFYNQGTGEFSYG